ncbi:MAG: hypothetical protein AAFN40_18060 [Cyanobacteria bacterium J06560_6]
MGRTRNILDLAMAGGALAAIAILAPLQVRQERSAFQAISPAQAVSPEVTSATQAPETEAKDNVEIAHFLGIAQFVKDPTQYQWVCDTDCGSASEALEIAEITEASLEGDQMTISYGASSVADKDVDKEFSKRAGDTKIGQLVGTLDSNGTFAGTYQVQSAKGLDEGPVTFTFAADGTAKSTTGVVKIAQ